MLWSGRTGLRVIVGFRVGELEAVASVESFVLVAAVSETSSVVCFPNFVARCAKVKSLSDR